MSDRYEAVKNDDYAGFSAKIQYGVGVVQVSRVAAGHPNGLALEVSVARAPRSGRWSDPLNSS